MQKESFREQIVRLHKESLNFLQSNVQIRGQPLSEDVIRQFDANYEDFKASLPVVPTLPSLQPAMTNFEKSCQIIEEFNTLVDLPATELPSV